MQTHSYDELARDVLMHHGIALGKEDPILVLHTINRRLSQELAASMEESVKRLRGELEELSYRWDQESRQRAERIVGAALTACQNRLQEDSAELTKEAQRTITATTAKALEEIGSTIQRLEWLVRANAVAATAIAAVAAWMLLKAS